MDDLIEALQIFKKYAPDCQFPTHCEHDVLYITSKVDADEVTKEDNARLDELSFFYSEEHDGYISYRFGSC